MNSFWYKKRFLLAVVVAGVLLLAGCAKKNENQQDPQKVLEQLFADNFLNRDFVVEKAINLGDTLTPDYNNYYFVMTKDTSFYQGKMNARNGTAYYSGTWASNADYSKLTIVLDSPSVPAPFVFLNRSWRFTKKDLPVMELAPWGTTAALVLHMRRL